MFVTVATPRGLESKTCRTLSHHLSTILQRQWIFHEKKNTSKTSLMQTMQTTTLKPNYKILHPTICQISLSGPKMVTQQATLCIIQSKQLYRFSPFVHFFILAFSHQKCWSPLGQGAQTPKGAEGLVTSHCQYLLNIYNLNLSKETQKLWNVDIIVSSEIPDLVFITYARDNKHSQNCPPMPIGHPLESLSPVLFIYLYI